MEDVFENNRKKLIKERLELMEIYLNADKENNNDELLKRIADIEYEINMLKIQEGENIVKTN